VTLLALVVRALDAFEDADYELVLACLRELEDMLSGGVVPCR
jgi:hypothetical protein